MSFIGVICKTKNENYIKQILTKKLKGRTVLIFTKENIENLKNITFETILILSNNEEVFCKREIVKNIIKKASYLVINSDEEINLNLLENMDLNVITFGFNSKSTITTSSVRDEGILLCVQRNMKLISGNKIEPQEISVRKVEQKLPTNIMMGIATMLLLYGKNDFEI